MRELSLTFGNTDGIVDCLDREVFVDGYVSPQQFRVLRRHTHASAAVVELFCGAGPGGGGGGTLAASHALRISPAGVCNCISSPLLAAGT
jgi:hypothetical protein